MAISSLDELLLSLSKLLVDRKWYLATAESCTGGGLAYAITSINGASDWFEQGFVTYSNAAKTEQLGVDEGLLSQFGAVSSQVAEAMARGAAERAGAELAVGITGIAGPTGGTDEKPVGTVWVGWAVQDGIGMKVSSERFLFDGDREQVRDQAMLTSVKGLQACLTHIK